jgi:glyoxylase-like metal-dependent hydrolase (beta-lactamase superfamily II)
LLSAFEEGQPPRLLFPKARFVVSRTAWQRAVAPHPRDRASFIPELPNLLSASGRLDLVDGSQAACLGSRVAFEFSDGHTPGLALATVGGDGGVVFCADLIPGRPWVHLPVTMGYDRYPERLIDEKRRFLEDKIARGVRLFFTHDLTCAVATPQQDGERFGVTAECVSLDGDVL